MLKNYKIVFVLILLSSLALVSSGCTVRFNIGGSSGASLGGVFKSENKGDSWAAKNVVSVANGSPKSIGSLNAQFLEMDPTDSKSIYFSSLSNGLFHTDDGGETWNNIPVFDKYVAADIAINPDSKCNIYIATQNRVVKTVDCLGSFSQVYFDSNPEVLVTSLAIDQASPEVIFAATSRGELIKSIDSGATWAVSYNFERSIKKILLSRHNHKKIFVLTTSGLFRSMDGGKTFVGADGKDGKPIYGKAGKFLAESRARDGLLFLAADGGILKSEDNGNTWKPLSLLSSEKDAVVNAIALGPKNMNEIYYVTNTTFYRSDDGGDSWATKKLPTTRAGRQLIVSFDNSKSIYMAVAALTK